MLVSIFIAVLVIILIRYIVKWWLNPLRRIPGPSGLPLIGNALDFHRNPDSNALILSWRNNYGPIFKYYSPLFGCIVYVADAASAKHILVTNSINYNKSEWLKVFLPATGSGMINTNGKVHANQRKLLNPEFSLANIKRYLPIFNSKAKELIQFWKTRIDFNNGKPIEEEVLKKFTHLTLDAISLSSFGYSFDCVSGGHKEESLAANKVLTGSFNILQRIIDQTFPFLKIFPSKERKEIEKAEKIFYGLINKVIKIRQKELTQGVKTAFRNDLLQTLLEMHRDCDENTANKRIFENVFLFMVAGHETTSATMAWTMYCLAKNPKIQEKAKKEISEVIGKSTEILWEDLERLKYLDCCIKESLRMYPPGSFVARRSITEDNIGGYLIPPGNLVYVGISALQQDGTFWKDPNKFNPERFESIDTTNHKDSSFPYWFLPFSRGPRMCIGYRFAQVELKVVLALLLRSFSFKLGKNQPEKIEGRDLLTLKPFPSPIIEIASLE